MENFVFVATFTQGAMYPISAVIASSYTRVNCAWCLVEQHRPLGNGSHGICASHAAQLREQARMRQQRRTG